MSRTIRFLLPALFILLSGACGAADAPPRSAGSETTELRSGDLERADADGWKLRAGGMTVSLEPRLRATTSRGRVYFKLRGRTSRNLAEVVAEERTGLVRSTSLKSPRVFEVALGDDGMEHVLSGQPLFVRLTSEGGERMTVRAEVAAHFRQADSGRLFVHPEIVPVRVGHELVLRGRYSLPEGHQLAQAFTDDDAEIVVSHGAGGGTLDLSTQAVLLAADRPEDPVYFDSWDGAETHTRSTATVTVDLEAFGLTDGDPWEVWPEPECEEGIGACLLEMERGERDTERCGLAPEVDACAGVVVAPTASDPARFAADLRREIWRRYAAEDSMTTGPDAVDVRTAVDRVDERQVDYVGPEAEGLERFDPAHVDVWRHRDPISSGREGHWYGAYDYGGNLLKLWRR